MLSRPDADLVRRDGELPDLALLLDADRLTARLGETLGAPGVGSVHVTYLRYKPGQSCLAACHAEADGQHVDFIAKAYRPGATGKLRKALARTTVPGPLGPGRFVLDDSTVLVSVFPNDAGLERLARLMCPDTLMELAARLGHRLGTGARVDTLRHNPERRFVGRLVAGEQALATVRCYGAQDYAGMVAKADALRSRGPLKLARRLTRMHRLRLLAFDWLHGDLLEDAIGRGTVPAHTMELVGSALAHLHGQEAAALPLRTGASEAAAVVGLARHLAFLHPAIAVSVRERSQQVAARLADETVTPRPLHGDFYAKQVLVDRGTAALIDLDRASRGDPAIDLARFRADLEASVASGGLDASEIDALVGPLLSGYGLTRTLPARLNLHIGAQLLRLAAHPFRRREAAWPEITAAILERVGTFLDRDTRDHRPRIAVSVQEAAEAVPPPARGPRHVARRTSERQTPCAVVDPFTITNDPTMPFLADALEPEQMARRFARARCGVGPADHVEVLGISVTRYKPGLRCLIAYDLAVQDARGAVRELHVMGKVRAQSADRSTHDLLEALWTGSFGALAGDGIAVPEPLGWIADVHMIVQRRIAGESLGLLLDGALGLPLVRRAADAIHKLHTASAPARRRHTADDEIRILRERLTRVARAYPWLRARIERLLQGCERLAARIPDGPVCGIHRDFYPDQLLADGDRLYLTDLDLYSEGPPALDIGNFAAHIDEYSLRHFCDPEHLADRHDMLVERYLQLSRRTTRAAIHIWTTLSLARHVAISTQFADRRPFTEALLDLCERRTFGESSPTRETALWCGQPKGARP